MNPSLRHKPVAVVPLFADTTSCIAVSYEGKAFGVKTGTRVGEAKRRCPKMIFVMGDHKNYVRYHNLIVEAVESCVPVEAVCSIDEIACRLIGSQQNVEVATALAEKIKRTIAKEVGEYLTCSIGLGPNRYLAKIAADMKKPNGLTVLRPKDLPEKLFSLNLRDLPGIGPRMEERLYRRDIRSMEKLFSLSADELRFAWGSVNGREMWSLLRGEDLERKKTQQKSISQSHVLPPELRNKEGALRILKKLTSKAALRMRRENFWAKSISIYVRFLGQESWGDYRRLPCTQDTALFVQAVNEMWLGLPEGRILATGMVFSDLVSEECRELTLFDDHRRARLTSAIDKVNDRFGKDIVHYGAIHETENLAPLRIAFTRIPTEEET